MPSDSSLNSKPNTSSPSGWQASNWWPSTRHLGADGNATRRSHLSGVQNRRSPPWHGNPKDCIRSRQFRVSGRSNPDALIDAFLNSNPVKPARSLRKEIRRRRKQIHAADFDDRQLYKIRSRADAAASREIPKQSNRETFSENREFFLECQGISFLMRVTLTPPPRNSNSVKFSHIQPMNAAATNREW